MMKKKDCFIHMEIFNESCNHDFTPLPFDPFQKQTIETDPPEFAQLARLMSFEDGYITDDTIYPVSKRETDVTMKSILNRDKTNIEQQNVSSQDFFKNNLHFIEVGSDYGYSYKQQPVNTKSAHQHKRRIEYETFSQAKKRVKSSFSKENISVLKAWFLEHLDKPYPTLAEREHLKNETGMDMTQIRNWFSNMRKRHWNPVKAGREPSSNIDFILFKAFQAKSKLKH
mmetsp:Transcript_32279/g.51502  ORF Transcript_32279/g.51502 Transcript_32279/m.51502 type:complete len:227 (-) Transcript_32279:852-1532(-)|eukprot:CAMPEP_0203744368 /NCGR_PEP_ID=MMETSP0098-20131031/465_1 /ASSEMBLY_ACC=CAM_ASM_000208 /TAXON_ID=96639 /ORGANISM=" , Strain NY0313808BC1" /LENGTH=226 /DNA_ID=CAMNT_0050631871 /DNA_START=18 /DNA_END=698 /DNA_ORIENTATION=-